MFKNNFKKNEFAVKNKALKRYVKKENNEEYSGIDMEEFNKVVDAIRAIFKISSCSTVIISKLKKIFSGELEKDGIKLLKEPIPPMVLLDMLFLYQDELKKANAYLDRKGQFSGVDGKINYDLSILVNKYETYKANKIRIEEENKQIIENIKSTDNIIREVAKKQTINRKNNSGEDLSKIFEEIEDV